MIEVAKVLIKSPGGNYLMLRRSDHPYYPNDPDLPGGTVDPGEDPLSAAVREADEEAGIAIAPGSLDLLSASTLYSDNGNEYELYFYESCDQPKVTLSWEHSSYKWVNRQDFLDLSRRATDSYMHMVHDIMTKLSI